MKKQANVLMIFVGIGFSVLVIAIGVVFYLLNLKIQNINVNDDDTDFQEKIDLLKKQTNNQLNSLYEKNKDQNNIITTRAVHDHAMGEVEKDISYLENSFNGKLERLEAAQNANLKSLEEKFNSTIGKSDVFTTEDPSSLNLELNNYPVWTTIFKLNYDIDTLRKQVAALQETTTSPDRFTNINKKSERFVSGCGPKSSESGVGSNETEMFVSF